MQTQLIFPGNGDTARLEIVLSDADLEAIRNGERRRTQNEVWVGGAETPQDQLPVIVQVVHEAHQTT